MDQSTAQSLFHHGATLVFLDLPEGAEFGIDYNSWTVGPKFKGVKMIPPGVHFVYYSACGRESEMSPRSGFFYNFLPQQVLVKKWNKQTEELVSEEVSAEEQDTMEKNKMEMDRFLGAYPYQSYKKWVSLSNHISAALVRRLEPVCGCISSVTLYQSQPSNTRDRLQELARQQEEEAEKVPKLPEMNAIPGTELRFTVLPTQRHPAGATPAQVTCYNMDHTYVLQQLLDGYEKQTDILGEIQFAFICFLIGQNLEAFEQWKKLVSLLCSCDEALGKYHEIFSQFIFTMHYHIQDIPPDFFVDIVSQNNFLTVTLQAFFSNLEASDALETLKSRGRRFRDNLQRRFNWDFTTESGEYAPVVVE